MRKLARPERPCQRDSGAAALRASACTRRPRETAVRQISGVGYLLHSFMLILVPALAGGVFAIVALPIFIGEATFCLWLLVKPLDERAWSVS